MDTKDVPVSLNRQNTVDILSLSTKNLLQKIFVFLSHEDLFAVRLVCKAFKEAVSEPQVLKLDMSERLVTIEDLEAVVVQPLLINIAQLTIGQLNDNNTTVKLFKRLEERCLNLCVLILCQGVIPKDVSLLKIGKRLKRLCLINLKFESASHFFETTPEDPVYENLRELSLYDISFSEEDDPPFKSISITPISNLRVLKLQNLKGFDDREYEHLKDSFVNLTELDLHDMKLNGNYFKQLNLSKLTKLNMYRCQIDNDFLTSLSRNTCELQELYVSDIDIGDTFSEDTFTRMCNLKRIQMYLCTFDNRMMSAIGSQLLNLTYWQMVPNNFNIVTDESLRGLEIQHDLEHIEFKHVKLTGFGLGQIARCCPVLKHLILNNCNARDDDMIVFEENFTHLVELTIFGLKITDSGLLKLKPRLSQLENLTLESEFVTNKGLLSLIPFLNAAKCINIIFGDSQSSFYYNCICKEECQLNFNGPEISEEVMITLTKQFRNATELRFIDLTLSSTEVKCISETQSDANEITIHNCVFDAHVAAIIFKNFHRLRNFYVCDGHITDDAFLMLMEGIEGRPIDNIDIENKTMPNTTTIRRFLPMITSVTVFHVRTYEYKQQMYVSMSESELLFVGMNDISDETVVTALKLYKEMSYLALVDTAVTAVGISEIAPMVNRVDFLRLRSKILGDETMVTIGNNFPSLKTLYMECDRVTDDGFSALGKHIESLQSLCVIRSQITDDGIKKIAPMLKSVTTLDLYRENVNVTKELVKFMKETYPDVSHYEGVEQQEEQVEVATLEQRQDLERDEDHGLQEPNLDEEHVNLAETAP